MNYCNNNQEKWLLEKGLIPDSRVKGITLTEAATFLHINYNVGVWWLPCLVKSQGAAWFDAWWIDYKNNKGGEATSFKTTGEALSWAITEAITHINQLTPVTT